MQSEREKWEQSYFQNTSKGIDLNKKENKFLDIFSNNHGASYILYLSLSFFF